MPSFPPRNAAVGNFQVKRDDVIAGRYRVASEAGAGNFARVLKAYDMKEDRMVAVKLLKREFQKDAEFENEILGAINRHDKDNKVKICKMESHFMWGDLPCFVFGLLGQALKCCKYGPRLSPDDQIADFAKQSCSTLAFLHFTCKMIHTDLKPENILLEKPDQAPSSGIGDGWAICDLGSASFFSTNPDQDLIQTRPYRAPEVVLGCPWSYGVDMFSMGCIFYELKTGHKLFDAMNDEQQLIMFEKRLGKIPSWLVRTAHPKHRRQFFDASDRLVHSPSVFSNPYGKSASTKRSLTEEFANEPEFLDFLRQCLHYDPVVRLRADEVAHHPWVKKFFNPTSQDGLLRKLPQSAYTAGVIRTPGQSLLKGDAPLTREDKERLDSSASASAAASAAPSNPDSRSGSGQQGGVPRIPSTSSLQELRRKEAEAAHHQAASAQSALRHPHLAPAAGMPSRSLPGSVPASSAMRAPGGVPLRGPPMMAPGRPMPPREPSHYLTSSQAYGSSVRGYNPHRAIPSPNLPGFPTAGRPYLTPPTF